MCSAASQSISLQLTFTCIRASAGRELFEWYYQGSVSCKCVPYRNRVVIISFGSLTYFSQGSLGSHYNIDESVFSSSVQTLANFLTS